MPCKDEFYNIPKEDIKGLLHGHFPEKRVLKVNSHLKILIL